MCDLRNNDDSVDKNVPGGGGGGRDSAAAGGKCLPPMWPGLDSQIRRQMWVEFVGSLLCTERFVRVLRFPLSSKTTI